MPTARIELATLRFSGWNVRFSCSIRRVVSSILASGTKIFFVPGEHGFSSFQVENVHWKCIMLLTSVSLKLTKIKIKLIYAITSSWEKKQNGGWKLRDTDWFYFSFYNPSCFFFMIRIDPIPVLFYFIFFIRSELVRVDPSWSDPDWRSELILSDFCTCLFFSEDIKP